MLQREQHKVPAGSNTRIAAALFLQVFSSEQKAKGRAKKLMWTSLALAAVVIILLAANAGLTYVGWGAQTVAELPASRPAYLAPMPLSWGHPCLARFQ